MAFQLQRPDIPKKHRPQGFEIIHEDRDLIIVNKEPGILSVAALWNKTDTVHSLLNHYIRKGNSRSTKLVYVVHRLDQATSGLMVFAKSEEAQQFLKNNWQKMQKNYFTLVHGKMRADTGIIESYLAEDEDYHVHSSQDSSKGKAAKTEWEVLKENDRYSLLKITLHTGKKNQIRVHMSENKTPVVGDSKYGLKTDRIKELMLHSCRLQLIHPFSKEVFSVDSSLPPRFAKLLTWP